MLTTRLWRCRALERFRVVTPGRGIYHDGRSLARGIGEGKQAGTYLGVTDRMACKGSSRPKAALERQLPRPIIERAYGSVCDDPVSAMTSKSLIFYQAFFRFDGIKSLSPLRYLKVSPFLKTLDQEAFLALLEPKRIDTHFDKHI